MSSSPRTLARDIADLQTSYVGTLHEINSDESTVSLENVRSFGTEGRKGRPDEEISPSDQVYEYIVFRGSDVKDLRIEDHPSIKENKPPAVPDDPAIVGVSTLPYQSPFLHMMKYSGCKSCHCGKAQKRCRNFRCLPSDLGESHAILCCVSILSNVLTNCSRLALALVLSHQPRMLPQLLLPLARTRTHQTTSMEAHLLETGVVVERPALARVQVQVPTLATCRILPLPDGSLLAKASLLVVLVVPTCPAVPTVLAAPVAQHPGATILSLLVLVVLVRLMLPKTSGLHPPPLPLRIRSPRRLAPALNEERMERLVDRYQPSRSLWLRALDSTQMLPLPLWTRSLLLRRSNRLLPT